ncbi:MAG TPA: rod shape-determining protein MreC [Gammaproteobacteria bacterium]|jgi:rod shape-determining protein MreC|nr:rod shape-determining protein MreC [Gammaproteobacteria bacterium]HIK72562.1 rod shape-determining protein MreC [Gammaproteobacteria bacterium]
MLRKEHKVSHISSEAIFAIPAMKPTKVLFSLIICFLLILSDINFKSSDILRGYGNDILNPIIYISKTPSLLVKNLISFFSSREDLRLTIQILEKENLKIQSINTLLEEISFENKRLNSLWDSIKEKPGQYSLVKKKHLSTNELKPVMTIGINRKEKGYAVNNAVISEKGILGRIISLGLYQAEVLLVEDSRSLIPVTSSSSRLHAILQGSGLGRLGNLKYIKKTANFEIGEKLYSSGLGGIFPTGYPIAKIESILDSPDNEFLNVKVSFLQSPLNQDHFLVLRNFGSDE